MSWDYAKCPTESVKCCSILNTCSQLLCCISADEFNCSAVVGTASPARKERPRADDINCFRAVNGSHALCHIQLCIRKLSVWQGRCIFKNSESRKKLPMAFLGACETHFKLFFILVINQIDAQNLFYNKFISCVYMFPAQCAHDQEVRNCIIQPLVS